MVALGRVIVVVGGYSRSGVLWQRLEGYGIAGEVVTAQESDKRLW